MCGIFGHITTKGKNAANVCLEGLKHLEYRGYDSAGISGIDNNELRFYKHVGKVSTLDKLTLNTSTAIAHTRWATHGAITEANAHPHFDEKMQISIVHNGIIENYQDLKEVLLSEGVKFSSETDTEVIVHLLARAYKGCLFKAMEATRKLLKGTFAIAAICAKEPDTIVCAAKSAPLIIGVSRLTKEVFLSSDASAFSGMSLDVFYLQNDEVAKLSCEKIIVVNASGAEMIQQFESLELTANATGKGDHDHYLIKEILEQPRSLLRAIENRIQHNLQEVVFKELTIPDSVFLECDHIYILGCGTSYHAGCIAKSMIEKLANKHVSVEIASEFRYGTPIITEKTVIIAISQSGETADTIAAVELAQQSTPHIIALCNVMTSTLARRIKNTLALCAGPEISVCSTKAFTSQLALLLLLAIKLGRLCQLSKEQTTKILYEMKTMIQAIESLVMRRKEIEELAIKTAHFEHTFFIGRQEMYPTSLEAALKLKEISYVNALGIAAGELKHGTIALISPECLTIALCGNDKTQLKLESNMMEILARNGPLLIFAYDEKESLKKLTPYIFLLPRLSDLFSPFIFAVATQLYAYYVAKERSCDIDYPRNLAKSVTVE